MNSRLKNLYKYLIENRKHEMEGWHEAYTRFYGKVEEIRNRIIKNREEGLSQNNDEDFLKMLLYERDNGIASSNGLIGWGCPKPILQKMTENHAFVEQLML